MTYQQMAAHYGTGIVAARPRKPQDKAKAEVGVQIIERWSLARLRHQTFFSLTELNQWITIFSLKGLLNLSRQYPNERLNKACQIANHKNLNRLKHIKSILLSNQDKLQPDFFEQKEPSSLPQSHENIRGPKSYH